LKAGYKDFFNKVRCRVIDELNNVYYDEIVSKYFNLEDQNKNYNILLKLSNNDSKPVQNANPNLLIRREDADKDMELGTDEVKLSELKNKDNQNMNIHLEKINYLSTKEEIK